jgi:hypothetical protein
MTADRNLTEFGFSFANDTSVFIRELFRDGVGTPVTVSLLNGKIIRVDHELTVVIEVPAAGTAETIDIEEYDATNALTATLSYDVVYGLHGVNDSTALGYLERMWRPDLIAWTQAVGFTRNAGMKRLKTTETFARVGTVTTSTQADAAVNSSIVLAVYSSGTYQRIKRATCPVGSDNAAWHGFLLAGGDGEGTSALSQYSGFLLVFDDPATYTKVNTDTLRVGMISTWARAWIMAVPLPVDSLPLEVPFDNPLLAEVPLVNSYPEYGRYFSGELIDGVMYYPDVASFIWFISWLDYRGASDAFLYGMREVPRTAFF